MYTTFLYLLTMDGYLGCFHVLAIVDSAAVNTVIQISHIYSALFFQEENSIFPEMKLLDLFLVFLIPSILFSIVAVQGCTRVQTLGDMVYWGPPK